MAKQYIPGISGLLTEPNPADSPSNTLSEAENVVIEQGGKVQSRHGLNVKEKENDASFYDDSNAISDSALGGGLTGNVRYVVKDINWTGYNFFPASSGTITGTGYNIFAYTWPTSTSIQVPFGYNLPNGDTIPLKRRQIKDLDDVNGGYPRYRYLSAGVYIYDNSFTLFKQGDDLATGYTSFYPYEFSIFVRREYGSCIVPVNFSINTGDTSGNFYSSANSGVLVNFNLDTESVESYIEYYPFPRAQYKSAKITKSSNGWYKLSIICDFKPRQTYTIQTYIYTRTFYGQAGLGYNSDTYGDPRGGDFSSGRGIRVSSFVPGNGTTQLDFTTSYPLLKVGDTLSQINNIGGLVYSNAYRISYINPSATYAIIEHPGVTTSGTSTNFVVSSMTDLYLIYPELKQTFNDVKEQYRLPVSSVSYSTYRATIVEWRNLTTKTRIYCALGASTQLYIGDSVKFSNNYTSFSAPTNLPSGIVANQSYKIIGTGTEVAPISGLSYSYFDLDVVTSAPYSTSPTIYISATDVQYYTYFGTSGLTAYGFSGIPNYCYTSQYTNILPFIKLLEYKDSADNVKTILFVKQNINSYVANPSGIFATNNLNVQNKYYLVDSQGNLGKYETLKYTNTKTAFNTNQSVYIQTENKLSEANVDDIDTDVTNKFFDIKWPAFPIVTFKLKKSTTVKNWLKAGYKCKLTMTFYRETGYTDKPGIIYESQPSVPIIIESPVSDSIPELYIDFSLTYESTLTYKILNEFTQANRGRKFGLRIYRTTIVEIDDEFGDEFFQCYQDISFDKFMASTIYNKDYATDDASAWALRDSLTYYLDPNASVDTWLNNSSALPIELNVGDYVNIAYDSSQTGGTSNRVVSADRSLTGLSSIDMVYPSKYANKSDYRPARLQVISKLYKSLYYSYSGTTKAYCYKFKTIDYVHNDKNFVTGTGYSSVINPNTTITSITDLNTVTSPTPTSYNTKILITRTYITELTINDFGIVDQPKIYTDSHIDGAINTNQIIPSSDNSISWHGMQVYSGIRSSLTANLYLTKQPKYEHIYLRLKDTGGILDSGYYTYKATTFSFPSQSVSFPDVGNPGNTFMKLFIDSPVFAAQSTQLASSDINGIPSKDVQITSLTNISNTLVTSQSTIPINVKFNSPVTKGDTALNAFQINATIYEQAQLSLRLTSTSGVVKTINITTTPVYNRRGYYSKSSSNGVGDYEYLRYDGTPNEANGIQLTNYKELAQRQAFLVNNPKKLSTYVLAGSGGITADTFNRLDSSMASGIFNVPGDRDGQYPSNGNVTGFTKTSATTSRGLFLDTTNGKIVIRADGTLGAKTNTLDLKSFDAPGYVLIQYNRYNGSTINTAQTTFGWKNYRTAIFSYQNVTQLSNGIYEFTGAKPVMSDLSYLESLVDSGSVATYLSGLVFDLFYIKASSAETIALYPYGNAPNIRSAYIDIDQTGTSPDLKYSAVLNEYYYDTVINDFGDTFSVTTGKNSCSPNEPFFTFHPHKKRIQEPIAFLSPNYNNHKFSTATEGQSFIKSESTLWDEYVQSIIDAFNKQFRINSIDATLRKGEGVGEFIIDYPDGQKIEMLNVCGSHEFYPNINTTLLSPSAFYSNTETYVTLASRKNNELNEKNLIKWSRRELPEITTPALYSYLGKSDKAIIGMAANSDDLFVFKEDGIWRCVDNGNTNFDGNNDLPNISTAVFSNNIICQAAGSIQEINDEIIFLSQYGFMSITGGGIQNISNAIQRDILTLLQTSPKDRIRSYVNESKNLYCCTLINELDSSLEVKSGTYIFNVKTRQWSFMDEEILHGISDSNGQTIAVYRQRPINATLLNRVTTDEGTKPTFSFTASHDSNNRLVRSTETTPLDMFYVSREQYTNKIKFNALDQYDYISETRSEGSSATFWIQKSGTNEFFIKTESIPAHTIFRNKFRTSVEHALMPAYDTTPAIGDTVKIVDSFVTLFANRSVYLKRINGSSELMQIRIKKTDIQNLNMLVYFEFVDNPPTWFSSMSNGYFNTTGTATYQIMAGVPTKITFNPESGNQPDTNKLFQEYMIHTETANKGALMSFKTDSQSSFTADRRFIYDSTATNRNVFRTYIPTKVARGRYLIRQVKHDLPLENLIITGQTIVMRDSGSTRVQKDKDDN